MQRMRRRSYYIISRNDCMDAHQYQYTTPLHRLQGKRSGSIYLLFCCARRVCGGMDGCFSAPFAICCRILSGFLRSACLFPVLFREKNGHQGHERRGRSEISCGNALLHRRGSSMVLCKLQEKYRYADERVYILQRKALQFNGLRVANMKSG